MMSERRQCSFVRKLLYIAFLGAFPRYEDGNFIRRTGSCISTAREDEISKVRDQKFEETEWSLFVFAIVFGR